MDYTPTRLQDDADRLHWALMRLFVVALYKPILRPTLRWMISVERRWDNRRG